MNRETQELWDTYNLMLTQAVEGRKLSDENEKLVAENKRLNQMLAIWRG